MITAHSSHGSIKFDPETGKVLECIEDPGSEGNLCRIALVNVNALRQVYGDALPSDVDILECAFWNDDGSYAPALRWDDEAECFVEQEEA